jgi:hypothetical protein
MATPNIQTDLIDINLAENTTDWNSVGGGNIQVGPDYAIQGTNALEKKISGNGGDGGMAYDNGAGINPGSTLHFFMWMLCTTPGAIETQANGGQIIRMGSGVSSGVSNYYDYYVNGSDTLPKGGMQNYAIRYAVNPDATTGIPNQGPSEIGYVLTTTGQIRGNNLGVDALRYGSGLYITEGELLDPITFSASAAVNDLNANRYGILESRPGGFDLKGKYNIGTGTNGATTASYFSDSNTSITFVDTNGKTLDDFSQIIFSHPTTFFELDTVSVTGIGDTNQGIFNVANSAVTGTLENCVFNAIGETFLGENTETTGSSWIGCQSVYQSGSGFLNTKFQGKETGNPTSSLISDDPALITGCTFELGSPTDVHYGIEIVVTGSYTFDGNTFIKFSALRPELRYNPTAGPQGDGDLTINIVNGGTFLNFDNDAPTGTVTINQNTLITLTDLISGSEVRVYESGTTTEVAGIENTPATGLFDFTAAVGLDVDIIVLSLEYENIRIENFTIPALSSEIPIQQRIDRNYLNPT